MLSSWCTSKRDTIKKLIENWPTRKYYIKAVNLRSIFQSYKNTLRLHGNYSYETRQVILSFPLLTKTINHLSQYRALSAFVSQWADKALYLVKIITYFIKKVVIDFSPELKSSGNFLPAFLLLRAPIFHEEEYFSIILRNVCIIGTSREATEDWRWLLSVESTIMMESAPWNLFPNNKKEPVIGHMQCIQESLPIQLDLAEWAYCKSHQLKSVSWWRLEDRLFL